MKQKLRKWMKGIVCMTVPASGCGTAETTGHGEASDAEQYLSNCEKAVVMVYMVGSNWKRGMSFTSSC